MPEELPPVSPDAPRRSVVRYDPLLDDSVEEWDVVPRPWKVPVHPEPLSSVQGGVRWRRPFSVTPFQWEPEDCHNRRWDPICRERSDAYMSRYPWARIEQAPAEPAPEAVPACGPTIVTTPPAEARAGDELVYRARAVDPHVVGFTWFLEAAPPGMTIDRDSGTVTWTPPDGGRCTVVIGVGSVHGRFARQEWCLCVRKARRARGPANQKFLDALRRKAMRPSRSLLCPVYPTVRWAAHRHPERQPRIASPPGGRRPAAMPLRN